MHSSLLKRRAASSASATVGRGPTMTEEVAGYLFISPFLAGFVLVTLGPLVTKIGRAHV